MKAICLNKIGKPDVLKISEQAEPLPDQGEVRVNLEYTGINFADVLSRKGLYGWAPKKPYILGMEGSGIIDSIGKGINPARLGQKVMVACQYGCYAEKVVVPDDQAIPVFSQYDMAQSAAFLINYMTAWIGLIEMARLQPTESVLITAAAGGVGTAAIQIASKLGSQVYGLTGREEKVQYIINIGAKKAFNYQNKDWIVDFMSSVGGADVILEMVGGDVYKACLKVLNVFGRLAVVGFASLDLHYWNPVSWWRTWRDIPRVNIMEIAVKSAGLMASHLGYLLKKQEIMLRVFDDLKLFIEENEIKPVISKIFPLEEAEKAHTLVESRKSTGKVLLKIKT